MNVLLLLTSEMRSKMPTSVDIKLNWGSVSICDDNGRFIAEGDHIFAHVEEETLKDWIQKCDIFVFGVGSSPMMQEFKVITHDEKDPC